ncbi:MAG: glycosyltransferase family 4 protein [Tunicatimonas sp.]
MNIALLAPIAWRTPPQHYGGWELVASQLAEGLVRRGHSVTLFATADSLTNAQLESVCPHPLNHPGSQLDSRVYETLHIAHAYERAAALEVDVLHNHAGCFGVPPARTAPFPVVTTLHGSAAETGSRTLYEHYAEQFYVSISDAERRLAPDLNYVATVHNGIDVAAFTGQPQPEDYLIVLGRMSPDKGIHLAIRVAQQGGQRLVLAGIVPPENQAYFEQQVQPHLKEGSLEFVGPVDHAQKNHWLSRAYASLHLVTYEEAFGLTMAESMACGTPVVAVNRGSVPEVVDDGQTGFVIPPGDDDAVVDAAVQALGKVGALDRAQVRATTQQRFDTQRMVDGYERVYETILRN